MRNRFDEELDALHSMLSTMGAYCESAIASATKALLDGDIELAKQVMSSEGRINQIEQHIEEMCLRLILQQQPVAKDLRIISSAIKMITDMERIGDQACDIAEIVTMTDIKPIDAGTLGQMAREAIKMVTESVEAFVRSDLELAKSVIEYDDVVDNLFDKVKSELFQLIKAGSETAEYALDILMIAKYFERIADHATNIAEWVVFSITGTRVLT
ncbi:MAG: phosphate signaling complex protein PhoU [Oscillospiraceae bacterium]|nr:phosphate signaling complex protein PhoU [Oscillospiraceae bacterium]